MVKKKINDNLLLVSRGERVKKIRDMLKISSEELARRVKFSRQSVSYWENGRQSGLSHDGAEACVQALKMAGIECDLNWLWLGIGAEPYSILEGAEETETAFDVSDNHYPDDVRAEEIKLFGLRANAVVMPMKHNAMKPLYQKGDWIGGHWQVILPSFIGQPCIVSINNRLEVRLLKRGNTKGYHLSFMTYLGDTMEPFELANQAITRVAPIVRVWGIP